MAALESATSSRVRSRLVTGRISIGDGNCVEEWIMELRGRPFRCDVAQTQLRLLPSEKTDNEREWLDADRAIQRRDERRRLFSGYDANLLNRYRLGSPRTGQTLNRRQAPNENRRI